MPILVLIREGELMRSRIVVVILVAVGIALVIMLQIKSEALIKAQEPCAECEQRKAEQERTFSVVVEHSWMVSEVTAYCPCAKCCGKWADGKFADGSTVRAWDDIDGVKYRLVAAPKRYAFGTILHVKEVGLVKVVDRGGAIKGMRLDLFFMTHQEALEFGRRSLLVYEERTDGKGSTEETHLH